MGRDALGSVELKGGDMVAFLTVNNALNWPKDSIDQPIRSAVGRSHCWLASTIRAARPTKRFWTASSRRMYSRWPGWPTLK